MIHTFVLTITALVLAFGIGMLAAVWIPRPTPTVVIQTQPAQPGNLGVILAVGTLILIWMGLAAMIL